ncbi:MerR family transcriptional regulator [Fervidibacillus halotolerans]|uniref:MerR family transcriptional regulator n=1 Tax=Fervidibacillus halotolerans TaxID=2980027 RepID=A0A9E8M1M1_9BACI|nr:MerR family transcriptional regulator [Fervidibacillus halotolerans]WAA13888.1 MerR family transcriptional regulator [Fervidibacillus halotolerans]
MYSIGEVSEKTGVTVRTLHYYDEIGLLKPTKDPKSRHRMYTDEDIFTLHKIISLKNLGMNLKQIRGILNKERIDLTVKKTLELEKEIISRKIKQMEKSINVIDRILDLLEEEGEVDSAILMSLVRSLQTEDEQKKWMKKYVDEQFVDSLFQLMKDEKIHMDKMFLQFAQKVKQLYGRPVDDKEVQTMVGNYLESSLQLFETEQVQSFKLTSEQVDFDELDRFAPSPFTKAEEKWLEEAFEYYFSKK